MAPERTWSAGDLLELASDIALEAGALLLHHHQDRAAIETKAGAGDVVSDADRASETLILRRLGAARPDDGVIAEESGETSGTSGLTWIVDPLDGSSNYVHGATPFAVSIAVCDAVNGRRIAPLAGVVYDPVGRDIFRAARSAGATLNDAHLRRRPGRAIDGALVGTGLAHTSALRSAQLSVLAQLIPHVGDLRRSGSAAVDLCWVAAGRIEAFFQPGLKVWDYAAAQLILTESGGDFRLAAGLEDSTETIVAAAPEVSSDFLAALAGAGIAELPR